MLRWAVIIFVVNFGAFTPWILELPTRIALGALNGNSVRIRLNSARFGMVGVMILQLMGFFCWFGVCLVPISFAKDMNEVYPVALWFVVPFFLGIGLAVFIRGIGRKGGS